MDKGRRAHCLYTELAAETGAIGFSFFMAIILLVTYPLWKFRRNFARSHPDLVNLATPLLLAVVAFLGTSIFLHLSYQRYYWLIIGLAGAGVQILQTEVSKTNDQVPVGQGQDKLPNPSIV